MKYLPFLALACFVAGCGSSEPVREKPAAADPRDSERAEIRSKINAKKQDLSQANADLSKITTEREQVMKQDASEAKTTRLIELQRLENDAKQRKAAVNEEIAQLEAQFSGQAAPPKPAKAGDALDELLASNDSKEKEETERRRKKAEDDAAADKSRIAKAEEARKAELDERSKQKIEGGRLAAGPEAAAFEDRWADVIQKVRTELQRYKRW